MLVIYARQELIPRWKNLMNYAKCMEYELNNKNKWKDKMKESNKQVSKITTGS